MEKRNSDEIDLYDLIVKCVGFLRSNGWLLLVLSIAGMLIFFGRVIVKKPLLAGKMLVTSSAINVSTGNGILMPLNSLVESEAVDSLAERLNITVREASAILYIRTEGIRSEKMSPFDSIYNIVTEVNDRSVIPAVQKGILHYLSENNFLKTRLATRRKTMLAIARRIDAHLRTLDSTRAGSEGGMPYVDYIELYKKQLDLQNEAQRKSEIEVIYSPIVIDIRNDRRTGQQLAMGLAAGFAAGLLLIFLRFIYRISKTTA